MRSLFALTALSLPVSLIAAGDADAGKYNPVLKIGDPAPAWRGLPGVDGKRHSLQDLRGKRAIVVVFTCNSCPYAVDYEDRIFALSKKFADRGVSVVAINVNRVEADNLQAMKQRAEEKGFTFPYVYDESQQIAKDFGATYTPEFFVLNKLRKVVYMGAMDDSPDGKNVKTRHVERALEATLEGRAAPVPETIAIGCGVRYERPRRKK